MPPEKKIARWKIVVGYVAFGFFSLLVGLFLTFPYDAIRQRVQSEAEAAGLHVRMGSLGPGFGVVAKNVEISKKATGDEAKPPEPLRISRISVMPSLMPLGLRIGASVLGGSATAKLGGLGDTVVRVDFEDLDFSQGNLKGFSGIDLSGRASGRLELQIPRIPIGGGPPEPDLGAANGLLRLDGRELAINGGTVPIVIPMYGSDPTPVDLPKVPIGDLEGHIKIEKGLATIDTLGARGKGLELKASGTVKLAKRLEYSEPSLEVRLKVDPDFQKSLGLIGMGLTAIGPDPKDPAWRMGRLTGYLGRPNFR